MVKSALASSIEKASINVFGMVSAINRKISILTVYLMPRFSYEVTLTLYQANAATLTPFSKEDKILIKHLHECKG